MSARAELRLPGTQSIRRQLWLTLGPHYLSAALYAPAPNKRRPVGYRHGVMLAWGSDAIETCRLDCRTTSGNPMLWVGSTAFDVSTNEAARISEILAPLGLRIIEAETVAPA